MTSPVTGSWDRNILNFLEQQFFCNLSVYWQLNYAELGNIFLRLMVHSLLCQRIKYFFKRIIHAIGPSLWTSGFIMFSRGRVKWSGFSKVDFTTNFFPSTVSSYEFYNFFGTSIL